MLFISYQVPKVRFRFCFCFLVVVFFSERSKLGQVTRFMTVVNLCKTTLGYFVKFKRD